MMCYDFEADLTNTELAVSGNLLMLRYKEGKVPGFTVLLVKYPLLRVRQFCSKPHVGLLD